MTLGQRIQQIRIEQGLSQEEFAEKLGTTRQTVSRWELDQTFPKIAKIVLISRVFSVSTDSILKDGISTFDVDVEHFTCGVYRGSNCEIVETEKFSLVIYCLTDKNVLGAKLYRGYENKKRLVAICERDLVSEKTEYAYFVEDSDPHTAICNSELASGLGAAYDPNLKKSMRRLQIFVVDHSDTPLPTVKESGIPKCLTLWRMADSYHATHDEFNFFLCTGKTEYIQMMRLFCRDAVTMNISIAVPIKERSSLLQYEIFRARNCWVTQTKTDYHLVVCFCLPVFFSACINWQLSIAKENTV